MSADQIAHLLANQEAILAAVHQLARRVGALEARLASAPCQLACSCDADPDR